LAALLRRAARALAWTGRWHASGRRGESGARAREGPAPHRAREAQAPPQEQATLV